jgi:hypothetical protein
MKILMSVSGVTISAPSVIESEVVLKILPKPSITEANLMSWALKKDI